MKARIVLLISIGLIAVAMVMGFSGQGADHRTTWDYKIVENAWDERQMTSLGAEGWELVAVDASRGDKVRAFYKREHLRK